MEMVERVWPLEISTAMVTLTCTLALGLLVILPTQCALATTEIKSLHANTSLCLTGGSSASRMYYIVHTDGIITHAMAGFLGGNVTWNFGRELREGTLRGNLGTLLMTMAV